MALQQHFEQIGNWLFHWRSYLPLALIALLLSAGAGFDYPFGSHALDMAWEMICLGISLFGLALRVGAVGFVPRGTSGRNTARQKAQSLNTTGLYSVMRHPLYLGNFFIVLGVMLCVRNWWAGAIYALLFWLYYERIMFAEEAFLRQRFGRLFEDWASRTPAITPRLANWLPPDRPFSLRSVLRREYTTFFAIILSFALVEVLTTYLAQHELELDMLWTVILVVGAVSYGVIFVLKKATHVLDLRQEQ